MTTDEFFTKYNYKPIDFDGAYGYQCVDLYRQYVKEVLGFPQAPPVTGAAGLWSNYDPKYYERISNTPTAIPKKGDILIWNTSAGGGYGHVAIANTANLFSLVSFDQNWPVGSYCHMQGHNYFGGLVGWLRPKIVSYTDRQALMDIRVITNDGSSNPDKLFKIKEVLNKVGV